MKRHKRVKTYSTFSANQTNAFENPGSAVPALFQIHALALRLRVRLTASAATSFRVATEAELDALLDALISRLTVRSGKLGVLVDNMSLSEFVRVSRLSLESHPEGLPRIGRGVNLGTTGQIDLNLSVRIPFSAEHLPHVREAHAPIGAYFDTDGIETVFGSGSATCDGTAWTVDASTTMTLVVEGAPVSSPVKVAPLRYKRWVTDAVDRIPFPRGLYYGLFIGGDTPEALRAEGRSVEIVKDNNLIVPSSEYDPILVSSDYMDGRRNPGEFLRGYMDVDRDDGVGPENLEGIPLIYTAAGSLPRTWMHARSKLTVSLVDGSTAWPSANRTYLGCMVQPIDGVGSPPGCGCTGGDDWVPFSLPGVRAAELPEDLASYLPQVRAGDVPTPATDVA